MGRHAAPSEDEPGVEVPADVIAEAAEQVTVPLVDVAAVPRPPGSRPSPRPRHAHPDDAEDDEVSTPAAKERATAADLRLLRADSALRNRVIAAVVVPFVLYFAVLVGLGHTGLFAVWIWLPLVGAGIFAGLLLDAAHAKDKKAR